RLGESVEEHIRLVHNTPDPDASRARYIRTLRAEATDLYGQWGKNSEGDYSHREILDEFRRQLGGDYNQCLGSFDTGPS
ncbi:MAG TPA: hypothetical protein VJI32_00935, partial [Candidatus Nanoarchaeia archaeon]|nr:hypothetical protein [Candidatus Nanoarchaeia archaeon]